VSDDVDEGEAAENEDAEAPENEGYGGHHQRRVSQSRRAREAASLRNDPVHGSRTSRSFVLASARQHSMFGARV